MVMGMGGVGLMVVPVRLCVIMPVVMSTGFAFGVIMAAGLRYFWGAATGRLVVVIVMMRVVMLMIVVVTAAGFSFAMIVSTILRDGAHLPVEEPHDAEDEAADQHLNTEAALAGQVVVDPPAGVEPNQHDRPEQEDEEFQKQQKTPGPFLLGERHWAAGVMVVDMGVIMVVGVIMSAAAGSMDVGVIGVGRPTGGPMVRGGGGRGAHDFNQVRVFSQGHQASMAKPAP